MITTELLQQCPIQPRPWGQVWWAKFLTMNYGLPPKVHVELEGLDNIPTDRPVCFAMNHTDRYNCWPFQWHMLRTRNQFSVTWVKAKYYQNFMVRKFLLSTSNIPLASRGYVISAHFKKVVGRSPTSTEYRFIRNLLDGRLDLNEDTMVQTSSECRQFLAPTPNQRLQQLRIEFNQLSEEVVKLNQRALDLGHNILVFPQGTRSKRLLAGHTGMAQMTQRLNLDIVPIGCMGSELCYDGNLPWAKSGTIRYKIGKPLTIMGEELGQYHIQESFTPFSVEAQKQFGDRFRRITDVVMDEVNLLLDEEYRFDPEATQSVDTKRFL